MPRKLAIIIKGNPALIKRNKRAQRFYKNLRSFLEKLGYRVRFDRGEPYTVPEAADLWIGHSRGSDRLRFAPKKTMAIGIGVPKSKTSAKFPIINHPKDEMAKRNFYRGKLVKAKKIEEIEDKNHYVLTKTMKAAILKILQKKESVNTSKSVYAP